MNSTAQLHAILEGYGKGDDLRRAGVALRPYLGYTPEWAARGDTDEPVWKARRVRFPLWPFAEVNDSDQVRQRFTGFPARCRFCCL